MLQTQVGYLVCVLDLASFLALKYLFGFVVLLQKFGGMLEIFIHNSKVRKLARANGIMGTKKNIERILPLVNITLFLNVKNLLIHLCWPYSPY